MVDVIVPTLAEVYGWAFLAIAGLAFLAYAWIKGKQEDKRTVKWIRDWEEY
jgi:hypothetical protein